MKSLGAGALATLPLLVGLHTNAAFTPAFAEEVRHPARLHEAALRHVAALPSVEMLNQASLPGATDESDCGPGTATTCCRDGCRDAIPPRPESCGGGLGKGLSFGLGVAAGAGIGLGLGRGAGDAPLDKEFHPFGLTDSLITAGAVAVALRGYRLVDRDPPALCRGGFSGCTGTEDSLGGIDAFFRRHGARPSLGGRAKANDLSYLTLSATLVLPSAFLLGADQPVQGREFWLSVESGAITAALLQVVKHRVNRPRPYAHFCEPGCGDDLRARDTQLSFFSGHTALAFSFAVSAGTIASMRSYDNAGWVLGSGLALATATGYLRIAADRHYFTDVLTGALVGAAVGYAVPRLHGTRDRPADETSNQSGRRAAPSPAVVLPVPLRGTGGGLWLHGGVGGGTSAVTLSWSF